MVGSACCHLVRSSEERSGLVETAAHHAHPSEHHWVRRLGGRHLLFDDSKSGSDVALGEMDHCRQRLDQPGVDPVDVEATCDVERSLGLGEAAGHERHPTMHDRQALVDVDEVVEAFDVSGHGVDAPDVQQLRSVVRHDVGSLDPAPGFEQMLDRRHQIARLRMPTPGRGVELGRPLRRSADEFDAQKISEQVVEPVPGAGSVECDHELVTAGERVEPDGAIVGATHLVDERSGEPLEHRRVEQSLSFGLVDRVEELVAQVVGDQVVVAMEGRDELGHIVVVPHRERGEHQSRQPTPPFDRRAVRHRRCRDPRRRRRATTPPRRRRIAGRPPGPR